MNVFEDLVVELKEENLLEDTVIDSSAEAVEDLSHLDETEVPLSSQDDVEIPSSGAESLPAESAASANDLQLNSSHPVQEAASETVVAIEPSVAEQEPIKARKGREFFKKRAAAEVSSLQMVEHVLTSVEREYQKVMPRSYDDFNAKKALNLFAQSDDEVDSQAHAEAEFALMQETEAWCSALAERDRNIPVSSIRQYCENSKPALSSQAMLSIARFYRNLPYSETVRAKFDFVITRLFSRPGDFNKRTSLFARPEMLTHINTLYNDWASIPLYAAEDDESKITLTALSFDDMAAEAENASSFDQLIESEFFARLRLFKESISELFYAPQVTASAIESNIRIGNAYVALIDKERRKMDAQSLHLKYEGLDQDGVSDTTGRTLELVDILRELESAPQQLLADEPVVARAPVEPINFERAAPVREEPRKEGTFSRLTSNATSVNRWVIVFAVLLISASLGIYVWANYLTAPDAPSVSVQAVDFGSATFQEHIKVAKLSGENLYVQLQPSWDSLPKEKRQEILQAIFKTSSEKGFTQVNLIGTDGKYVGYALASRLEVTMP